MKLIKKWGLGFRWKGWMKWREGKRVLCDNRVPLKVKGKFYATVVRPSMTYASECWALRKDQERRLQVAEMHMLRMMMGITRKYRCRNDWVRERLGVADVGDKMAENRMRWYEYMQGSAYCKQNSQKSKKNSFGESLW